MTKVGLSPPFSVHSFQNFSVPQLPFARFHALKPEIFGIQIMTFGVKAPKARAKHKKSLQKDQGIT